MNIHLHKYACVPQSSQSSVTEALRPTPETEQGSDDTRCPENFCTQCSHDSQQSKVSATKDRVGEAGGSRVQHGSQETLEAT